MSFSKHENCEAVGSSYSAEKVSKQETKPYALYFVPCGTYSTYVICSFTQSLHELLRYIVKWKIKRIWHVRKLTKCWVLYLLVILKKPWLCLLAFDFLSQYFLHWSTFTALLYFSVPLKNPWIPAFLSFNLSKIRLWISLLKLLFTSK